MHPALIVHGGAWDIPDEAVDACKSGCHRALTAGWSILAQGGSALDAIEAAIVVLEDDPVFDAGYGSHLRFAQALQPLCSASRIPSGSRARFSKIARI